MEKTPRYIAVEGPIGVGKTSFAKRLASSLNYEMILENPEENPFLERFYQNRKQAALQTQLFFLFERARQIQELRQADLFEPVRVADFLIEKDRLFAELNLDSDELKLYENIYAHLTIDAPAPDLVVYLQAPTDTLLTRIQQRAIKSEQQIEDKKITKGLKKIITKLEKKENALNTKSNYREHMEKVQKEHEIQAKRNEEN